MNVAAHRKSSVFTRFGFTLIELLVVVSIIGLLATLITANLNAARSRSRDAVRKGDLKNLQTALRLYYNDKGIFPASISWGEEWSDSNILYMSVVPNDPLPDQSYSYVNDSASDSYTLTACLENISDSKCDKDVSGNMVTCADGAGCEYTLRP